MRKSVRAISIVFPCLRMFEGRILRATRRSVPQDCIPRARRPPGRRTTRCNYSRDFLVPVEGVSLILSRVYASALHLIAPLHLHKGRSIAPLYVTFIPRSRSAIPTPFPPSSEITDRSDPLSYVSRDDTRCSRAAVALLPSRYIGIIAGQVDNRYPIALFIVDPPILSKNRARVAL